MKIVHKRTHYNARTETWRRIVVFEVEAGEAPEPNEMFHLGGFHSVTPESTYSPTGLITYDEPWVELLKHQDKVMGILPEQNPHVRVRIEQVARRDV